MWQTIKQKTKAGYQWILGNLKKTAIFVIGLTATVALGASVLPADPATFNVHKNQIAVAMTEQVFNASSTLPFQRENATFRKYNKETSGFLTIGKKGSDIFVPEFTIENWKETKFTLKIPTNVKSEDQSISFPTTVKGNATTSKLKWTDGINDAVFYELDNGDFEFEFILYAKPPTNTITFDIETENLDFFKQLPLWEEQGLQAPTLLCTDTDCDTDDDGELDTHRPEDIVDSYAVFHSIQSGDYSKMGGQNYKTGKAGHWKRSKIFSNVGDFWAEDFIIDSVAGKMSIIIPTEIYDDVATDWASGVILDPTFGYTAIGGSGFGYGADNKAGSKFNFSASGDITAMHIYGRNNANGANKKLKTNIYSDSSGTPNALLASDSTEVTQADFDTPAWHDTDTTVTLNAGDYWLMHIINGTFSIFYDTGATNQGVNNSDTYSDGFADPFGTPTFHTRKGSIYATYTTATPTIADFSHFREITICGSGGGAGCSATTTTNGYAILATTTEATLAVTGSGGRIEVTRYDSENNLEYPLDLIYTNDADELLNFHIEKYSTTTGEIVSWIEVDDISSTTPKTFKIFYGNASATGYENPQDTWNSTYAGVWHLPEDPSTSAPQMLDSTSNNNDGTSFGTMLTEDQVDGQIDGSLDFDGGGDYVDVEDSVSLDVDFLTASFWAKWDSFSNSNAGLIAKGSNTQRQYWFWTQTDTSFDIEIDEGGTIPEMITPGTLSTDIWYHIVFTYDGDNVISYVNGSEHKRVVQTTGTILDSSTGLSIGELPVFGGNITTMDEARIYNTAIHSMDILTNYNMGVDNTTFLSFGAEQATGDVTPAGSTPTMYIKGIIQVIKGLIFQ